MKKPRNLALLAILFVMAACSSSSSPDKVLATLTMGDTVQSLRPFTSSADGNSVTVLGAIATPDPCYNFTATSNTEGNVIEATVKADSKGGACVTQFNRQNYTLALTSVPEGTWTIRVMHQENGGQILLQYETTITIK